jgi:hypothetical protein
LRLAFVDRAAPGAQPLAIRDLRLRSAHPIALLGDDPGSLPPIALTLTAAVAPIARAVTISAEIAAFAPDPTLSLDIALDGLRAAGLVEVAPPLADRLAPGGMTDGALRAHLDATIRTGRSSALDFDPTRPFGAELALRSVALRPAPGAAPVLGIEEVHVDLARVVPKSGEVVVRQVEIARPIAHVAREADGLHAAGLVLRPPLETATAAPPPAAAPRQAAPQTSGADATPEVRVDRVLLTDIDVWFRDGTCSPPLYLPLGGLDAEIAGFTTRGLRERVPVRFRVSLEGGPVPLPKSGGGADAREERPLFQEIAVRGELAVAPRLDGEVRASVAGLELPGFAGPAAQSGIVLGAGTVDLDLRVQFARDGLLHGSYAVTLADLSLSEPAGGPIQRILHLPAPLDSVVFLLRDQDGAIKLSQRLPEIGAGADSSREIASAAISALGQTIARAVAASPLRAVGTLGDIGGGALSMLGLGGAGSPAATSADICFAPADTALPATASAALAPLIARLRSEPGLTLVLRHQVGGGDLARARVLANPSPEDRSELIARLEARRASLAAERETAAQAARAAIAAGLADEAREGCDRVRTIERRLGETERALSEALDLTRPGAAARSEARARAAALAVARERLAAVRAALLEAVPGAAERVKVGVPRVEEPGGAGGGVVLVRALGGKKAN